MTFFRLVSNELYKALRQKRIYLFLLFPLILAVANELSIRQWNRNHPDRINTNFASEITYMSLSNILIFVGFFYAIMVVSFFLAEDYSDGTLKLSIMRPISRFTILNSKITAFYITVLLFFATNFLFIFITTYILGDPETVMVFANSQFEEFQGLTFPFREGLAFLAICYLLATISIFVLGLIFFFFSTVTGKPSVAVTLSIIVFILCYFYMMMLGNTPYIKYSIWTQFQFLYKNYYFEKLDIIVPSLYGTFKESVQICFAYAIVFYPLTAIAFCRKSILK